MLDRSRAVWLPLLAAAAGILVTVLVVLQVAASQREAQTAAASAKLEMAVRIIESALSERLEGLRRMALRWERQSERSRTEFDLEADVLRQSFPSFRAIGWVGPDLRVRWVYPEEENRAALGLSVNTERVRANAFRRAREQGAAFTPPLDLVQGGRGILGIVSIRGREGGYVYGALDLEALFRQELRAIAPDFAFAVTVGQMPALVVGDLGIGPARSLTVELAGVPFRVSMAAPAPWPALPLVVLIFGTTLSSMLALALHGGILARAATSALRASGEALLLSEGRYRAIFDTAVDAIVVIDAEGNIQAANTAVETMFGYPAAEVLGQHISRLMPELHADRHAAYLVKNATTGEPWTTGVGRELYGRRKDGSNFPFEVSIGEWSAGDSTFFTALIRDITERKAAEDLLRRRTAELQELTNTLDLAPVLIRNMEDRVTHWTSGASALYGWTSAEALGQVTHDLLDTRFPQDKARWREQLMETGYWRGELQHRRKDGGIIEVKSLWFLHRGSGGEPRSIIEVNTDITARKEAERQAAASLRFLQSVVDGALDPIFVKDLDGRYLLANTRTIEILGAEQTGVVGRRDDELIPTNLAREIAVVDRDVLRSGNPRILEESIPVRGALHTFLSSKTPLRSLEGETIGLIGVARDITDRKRVEQEIRELNRSLEERVAERTRQLEDANAELQSFAHNVAHDLRAPLRGMRGFAQALEEDYAEALDERARTYLARISDSADRMDLLIQDLLAYAKISREHLVLSPVHLDQAVQEALTQVETAVRETGAQVAVNSPLPTVLAHRGVLIQVLANLFSNALKFTPPGTRPEISLRADAGQRVRLHIEDNGIGIAPEHQGRIFQVFQRLHGTREYPGTGIGLAIVRRGVERMRGASGVESELGRGSRFWIELQGAHDG